MRNLILIDRPGGELGFAGLVQQHPEHDWTLVAVRSTPNTAEMADALQSSAAWLGLGEAASLGCPPLPDDLLPIQLVAGRLQTIGPFDRVYTHSYASDRWGECITAVAAATVYGDLWVASDARTPDELVVLTPQQYQHKVGLANSVYAVLLRDRVIGVGDLSSVETYCKVEGTSVLRYFAEMARMPVYDLDDPWDNAIPAHERIRSFMPSLALDVSDPWYLASSDYEKQRYRLELSILDRISWSSLVELGACVGRFTLQLLDAYSDRKIIACEPYEPFVRKLKARLGGRAQVLNVGADQAIPDGDVIFASSCLYYARPFPITLLGARTNYFVFSHCYRYQKKVIEPCMRAMGHELVSEDELPARVEEAYGLADVKDGTVVQVWKAGHNLR